MSNLPAQTTPIYCTDEDILVRAGGDWSTLTPSWQQMAFGSDGVFSSGTPWVLTSATVDFAANGVSPNQVVQLTAPKSLYPGGGQFLAIDSIVGNAITLRRPHKDLGVGQPPGPIAGASGVVFAVNTLDPQSEEASFDIKRRFSIDEVIWSRSSTWIYDLRDLRMATVLSVLYDRYSQEARTEKGDFTTKIGRIRQQLDDVMARVQVRWGPLGDSQPPSTLFNCRLSR